MSAVVDRPTSNRYHRDTGFVLAIEHGAWWSLRSDSMAPTLLTGDRVRVAPAEPKPRVGAIYAYKQRIEGRPSGQIFVHRYIGHDRLAGDACRFADARYSQTEILGRVVEARRDARPLPVEIGRWRVLWMNLRRKLWWRTPQAPVREL